jgi:hypothetical protein
VAQSNLIKSAISVPPPAERIANWREAAGLDLCLDASDLRLPRNKDGTPMNRDEGIDLETTPGCLEMDTTIRATGSRQ